MPCHIFVLQNFSHHKKLLFFFSFLSFPIPFLGVNLWYFELAKIRGDSNGISHILFLSWHLIQKHHTNHLTYISPNHWCCWSFHSLSHKLPHKSAICDMALFVLRSCILLQFFLRGNSTSKYVCFSLNCCVINPSRLFLCEFAKFLRSAIDRARSKH